MRPSLFLFLFIILLVPRLGHAELLNSNNPRASADVDADLDNSKFVITEEGAEPPEPAKPIISIDIKGGDSALEIRQKLVDRIYGITIDERQQLLDSVNSDFENFSIQDRGMLDKRMTARKLRRDNSVKNTFFVPVEKLDNSIIEAGKKKIEDSFNLVLPEDNDTPPNGL